MVNAQTLRLLSSQITASIILWVIYSAIEKQSWISSSLARLSNIPKFCRHFESSCNCDIFWTLKSHFWLCECSDFWCRSGTPSRNYLEHQWIAELGYSFRPKFDKLMRPFVDSPSFHPSLNWTLKLWFIIGYPPNRFADLAWPTNYLIKDEKRSW